MATRRAAAPARRSSSRYCRGCSRRSRRSNSVPSPCVQPCKLKPVQPLVLKNFTASSCIGVGAAATLTSLLEQRSGLENCRFETVNLDTYVGEVSGVDDARLPETLRKFDCRNNRLAELALRQDDFIGSVR